MNCQEINPSIFNDDEEEENWSEIWQEQETRKDSSISPRKTGTVAQNSSNYDKNEKAAQKDGGAAATADASIMSRMALNDNKAGMQGLDREKINKIIYEASKGKLIMFPSTHLILSKYCLSCLVLIR